MKQELTLKIEEGDNGLWGQVSYEDNLITTDADNEEELIKAMQDLLFEFHDLDSDTYIFKIEYSF